MDHSGHSEHAGHGTPTTSSPPVGLSVAQDGATLVPSETFLRAGDPVPMAFTIQREGQPITEFDVLHERRMHLIVVRRDLTGFQHVHPSLDGGQWTAELAPLEAGVWRVFADFSSGGRAMTLGIDVHVDGHYAPRRLPDPADEYETAGLTVRLHRGGDIHTFTVEDSGGGRVEPEPYLGARGHLVALREGDLAFLHVHPAGGGLEFAVLYPSPGRYRLFVQFSVAGTIHVAEFTVSV